MPEPGNQKLTELAQQPGIKDLPSAACRLYFAKAIISEQDGNYEDAEKFLNKAVAAEATVLASREVK